MLFASLASLLAMVYAGSEWWSLGGFGFPSDAGWSRAVFARNLASGQGLSFNAGMPVAGAAAPAWIAALALPNLLLGYIPGAKLLGTLCVILTAFLVWRITLDLLGDWRFAFLAGLLVAASPRLVPEALGGSEGAISALLVAALVYWQGISWGGERRQRLATGLAAGLAALSRPELILILPLMLLDRWLTAAWHAPRGRRLSRALAHSLPELLMTVVVLAPYLIWNWRAGGPLWQQPELALRARPALLWTRSALVGLWASNPLLVCGAVLGIPVAVLAATRAGSRHPSFLAALALVVLLPIGYIWRDADPDGGGFAACYLAPSVTILGTAGLFLVKRAAEQALLRSRRRALRLAFAPGMAVVLMGLLALVWLAHSYSWRQHGFMVKKENDLHGYIGRWAAEHTAPDASIAAREIGAIGFWSRRRMVDLGGSMDRNGLEYLRRPGSPDSNLLAFLQETQPSYLAIRPSDFPDLSQRIDLLTPAVTCSEEDPFTGGVTTWALYETPWPAPSVRAARPQAPTSGHRRRRR